MLFIGILPNCGGGIGKFLVDAEFIRSVRLGPLTYFMHRIDKDIAVLKWACLGVLHNIENLYAYHSIETKHRM